MWTLKTEFNPSSFLFNRSVLYKILVTPNLNAQSSVINYFCQDCTKFKKPHTLRSDLL
jgi:hypothetical protein